MNYITGVPACQRQMGRIERFGDDLHKRESGVLRAFRFV